MLCIILSQMEHDGENFTLRIHDATRGDSGAYILKAVNTAGASAVEILVEVSEITEYVENSLNLNLLCFSLK